MGATTTYRAPRAAALANPTTEAVFLNALPSGSTTACIAYIPGSSIAEGKVVRITVAGKATGGTTTNLTIAGYVGSSTTVGSDSALFTSGAKAINSASGNFVLEFRGSVDTTSGILIGTISGYVNATAVAAAISSAVTTQTPAGADIPLVLTALFSASNASNTVSITEFDVSVD